MARLAKKYNKKPFWLAAAAAVLIVAVAGWLIFGRSNKPSVSVIPSTSAPRKTVANSSGNETTNSSGSTDNGQTDSSKQTPASSPQSSGTLIAPSAASLVSNHHPSSGDSEASVCTTTPGASCYIQFTMGNTVKRLEAQTTDGDGNAYWNWNVKTAGLSAGTWVITAVASLNGQTLSAQDAQNLQVQP